MGDYAGHPITRAAPPLLALLFRRPGELRQLECAWVDLKGAVVTIPSALMKRSKADKANRAPHVVPLAPQAAATSARRPARAQRSQALVCLDDVERIPDE
jgi:integrase